MNAFEELLSTRQRTGDTVTFHIATHWLQGRTTFGGVAALLGAQAMRDVAGQALGPEAALRGLQTSFVGPVGEGPVEVQVAVLRQGRNITQLQATSRQAGQVVTAMLGTFGAARASNLPLTDPVQATAARGVPDWPVGPQPHPPREGMPGFLRHFDMHWAEGAKPFSGTPGLLSKIHLRLRGEAALQLAPELQAVVLGDLPATPVVSTLSERAPSSSVTWALELCPPLQAPGHGFWRIDCESLRVRDGYVNHTARLWAPNGQLAALGTQVVAIFA